MEKHAKKKAKEILKKYTDLKVTILGCVDRGNACVVSNNLLDQSAKQCALIAVKEIQTAILWHDTEIPHKEIEFWYQVKNEIEKL